MTDDEIIKKYPECHFSPEELKKIRIGYGLVQKDLEKYGQAGKLASPADFQEEASRYLEMTAYQGNYQVDKKSWKELYEMIITDQANDWAFVRKDAVYQVKTTRGEGIFIFCTVPNGHFFSLKRNKGFPPEVYHYLLVGEVELEKQIPGKLARDAQRIRETEKLFRDPHEAKSWLTTNLEGAFASHVFPKKQDALEFVDTLYKMGAEKISVSNFSNLEKNKSFPYADNLTVVLPKDRNQRAKIFDFLNHYKPPRPEYQTALCQEYSEEGQEQIDLFWEY